MKDEALAGAAAEARRAYFRDWRKRNSDKVKKYNETYWRRKAARERKEGEDGTAAHDDRP